MAILPKDVNFGSSWGGVCQNKKNLGHGTSDQFLLFQSVVDILKYSLI